MTYTDADADRYGRALARAIEAETKLAHATGEQAIAIALDCTLDTRAELARLSGMTAETLRAIERGKRPTRAQRAALCWAIVKRWT